MTSPALDDSLKTRWAITASALIADTHTSKVYRVRLDDGSTAIVKALKPEGMGELPGMAYLAWRGGTGSIDMLDRLGNTCLLEDAGETILRSYHGEHGEDAANAVITDIVAKLHSPGQTEADGLVPLSQNFRALFAQAAQIGNAFSEPLRFCAQLAERLLSTQTDIKPLHGDLHHDNIVSGGKRGWLAIDPQGLIGDPAYDVANIFGNPLGAGALVADPQRIVELTRTFAPVIGCTEEKILHYALAHAGLSICWSMEKGTTPSAVENIGERLAFLKAGRRLLEEMA
jgi:streptomycin 6-kinase